MFRKATCILNIVLALLFSLAWLRSRIVSDIFMYSSADGWFSSVVSSAGEFRWVTLDKSASLQGMGPQQAQPVTHLVEQRPSPLRGVGNFPEDIFANMGFGLFIKPAGRIVSFPYAFLIACFTLSGVLSGLPIIRRRRDRNRRGFSVETNDKEAEA